MITLKEKEVKDPSGQEAVSVVSRAEQYRGSYFAPFFFVQCFLCVVPQTKPEPATGGRE